METGTVRSKDPVLHLCVVVCSVWQSRTSLSTAASQANFIPILEWGLGLLLAFWILELPGELHSELFLVTRKSLMSEDVQACRTTNYCAPDAGPLTVAVVGLLW